MEKGSILISGYISQNNLIIQISDDGIGIEKEVLPLILKENNLQTKGSGYGLKNIKKTVEKYDGYIEDDHANNTFSVDIILFVKPELDNE